MPGRTMLRRAISTFMLVYSYRHSEAHPPGLEVSREIQISSRVLTACWWVALMYTY